MLLTNPTTLHPILNQCPHPLSYIPNSGATLFSEPGIGSELDPGPASEPTPEPKPTPEPDLDPNPISRVRNHPDFCPEPEPQSYPGPEPTSGIEPFEPGAQPRSTPLSYIPHSGATLSLKPALVPNSTPVPLQNSHPNPNSHPSPISTPTLYPGAEIIPTSRFIPVPNHYYHD
jgi:hypothetical protein